MLSFVARVLLLAALLIPLVPEMSAASSVDERGKQSASAHHSSAPHYNLLGRVSGGMFSLLMLAVLLCVCCAGCWRLRRYLTSLTGRTESALPMVGVPAYSFEQQQQQLTASTLTLPPVSSRPYHIDNGSGAAGKQHSTREGAAVEMSSTASQPPPSYSSSASDSSQQPAAAIPTHEHCPTQPAPFASYSQPGPPMLAQPTQYPYGQPYMQQQQPRPMYGPAMMPGAMGGMGGGGYGMGSLAAAGVGGLLLGEVLGGGLGGGGMGGGLGHSPFGLDGGDGGDMSADFSGGDGI